MIGGRRAGMFVAGITLIAPIVHAQDSVAFAEQRYRRGVELFVAENYAQALNEFQMSLQLFDSPNARLFVARCLGHLNRPVQALAEFERTARDAEERAHNDPRYVATRDAARVELRDAEQHVGRLTVIVRDPPGELHVTVGGEPVLPAALGLPLPVVPGPVIVSVSAAGYVPFERQVLVEAGQTEETTVTLLPAQTRLAEQVMQAPPRAVATVRPEPRSSSALRTVGWTGLALGVVGAAGFGVSYGFALGEYHRLEQMCGGAGGCATSPDEAIGRGSALEITAYAALTFGIVNAALGITSLAIAPRHGSPAARVSFGPNSVGVTCAF